MLAKLQKGKAEGVDTWAAFSISAELLKVDDACSGQSCTGKVGLF